MGWLCFFILLFLNLLNGLDGSDKNLYDFPNSPVLELNVESYQQYVLNHKHQPPTKMLIVFYAPWCGHCQRFAPEFLQAAKVLQEKYNHQVLFGAVNCVAQRTLCQDNEVASYPTIRAFGFGKDVDKEYKKSDGYSISSINKFLEKHSNLILPTKRSKNLKGSSFKGDVYNLTLSTSLFQVVKNPDEDLIWRQRTMLALARFSSSIDRLHDALVSLRFLIEVDVMAQPLSEELKVSIDIFYGFLLPLLPEEPRELFRRYYDEIRAAGVLSQNRLSNDYSAISDSIAETVFGTTLRNWRVCGIILEKTFSVTEKRMKLIEHEFDELFESSKSGYTCGLWMLFHYLTVASQHVTSSKSEHTALTTHDIMSFIRMTVEKLFNCRTCREHFLHMYDKCLYGRCEISDYDYNKLQIWLWSVHNDATLRILNYHLPQDLQNISQRSHSMEMEDLRSKIRWPGAGQCAHCFKEKSDNLSGSVQWGDAVVEYLQLSYWDPSWHIEAPESFTVISNTRHDHLSRAISSTSFINPALRSYLPLETHIATSHSSTLSIFLILFLLFLYGITYKRSCLSYFLNSNIGKS